MEIVFLQASSSDNLHVWSKWIYHKNYVPHNITPFYAGPVCSAEAAVTAAYLWDLIYLEDVLTNLIKLLKILPFHAFFQTKIAGNRKHIK